MGLGTWPFVGVFDWEKNGAWPCWIAFNKKHNRIQGSYIDGLSHWDDGFQWKNHVIHRTGGKAHAHFGGKCLGSTQAPIRRLFQVWVSHSREMEISRTRSKQQLSGSKKGVDNLPNINALTKKGMPPGCTFLILISQ